MHRVDWQLLILFIGLFVVNGAMQQTGLPQAWIADLKAVGFNLENPVIIYVVTAILSDVVSNVPSVMLLLPFATDPSTGPVMAVASGLSSNLNRDRQPSRALSWLTRLDGGASRSRSGISRALAFQLPCCRCSWPPFGFGSGADLREFNRFAGGPARCRPPPTGSAGPMAPMIGKSCRVRIRLHCRRSSTSVVTSPPSAKRRIFKRPGSSVPIPGPKRADSGCASACRRAVRSYR